MRRAAHTDTEHANIRQALRAAGFVVIDTSSQGSGFPDLLVVAPDGRVCLMEIKTIENMRAGKLVKEIEFMLKLVNPIYRMTSSIDQAIEIMYEPRL